MHPLLPKGCGREAAASVDLPSNDVISIEYSGHSVLQHLKSDLRCSSISET